MKVARPAPGPASANLHNNGSEQFTRNTANALRVTLENSPSKAAAADQPAISFQSMPW
jgi:hypothetical protein